MQLAPLELLAPAKDREIGIAAVNCGADSLYIGGPSFGAREGAGNSIEEIEQLANYASRYGVKSYLVLNTILYQQEVERARELAWQAYEAGVAALIIQDLSLLQLEMSPLPLFASTQTNIRSVEQAKLLESLGFSRLILARELSLAQIEEISKAVSVELESFIHGALCVSYSGECYISSRVTGRSGNRGECAQLCRSSYNLVDSRGVTLLEGRPLLSLKDLNLTHSLEGLVASGVTSFKIEGRLKGLSYVKNVVSHYRREIDLLLAGDNNYKRASFGKSSIHFIPNPQLSFNRRFTPLYIEGERGDWSSGESAGFLGEPIGRVVSSDRSAASPGGRGGSTSSFVVEGGNKIVNGDGLAFLNSEGEVVGVRASVVNGERVETNETVKLREGTTIYRNYNKVFEESLLKSREERVIEIELHFEERDGEITIEGVREDGEHYRLKVEGEFEEAKEVERAKESVKRQLEKGWEEYNFNLISYSAERVRFFPLSTINGWRRAIGAAFRETPIVTYSLPPFAAVSEELFKERPLEGKRLNYKANIANSVAEELYRKLGAEVEGRAFEVDPPKEAELMRCKYCIKYQLGACPFKKGGGIEKGTIGEFVEPLYLLNGGRRFRLHFDCHLCEMVIFG